MRSMQNIILSPIITDEENTIVFKVARYANKIEIKNAIEKLFKVKVLDVRSANIKGKRKRVGRNIGSTPNYKKAYVTLAKGAKIGFFEGV